MIKLSKHAHSSSYLIQDLRNVCGGDLVASYDSHLPGYVGVTCQKGAHPTNARNRHIQLRFDTHGWGGVSGQAILIALPGSSHGPVHYLYVYESCLVSSSARGENILHLGRVFDFCLMIEILSRQIDSEYVGSSSRCRFGTAQFESSSASTCVLGWRGTTYSDSAQPLTTVSEELLQIICSRYIDRYILICAWCSIYIYSLNNRLTKQALDLANQAVEQGVFTFLPPRQMGA